MRGIKLGRCRMVTYHSSVLFSMPCLTRSHLLQAKQLREKLGEEDSLSVIGCHNDIEPTARNADLAAFSRGSHTILIN